MASVQLSPAPAAPSAPALSPADAAAHEAASYIHPTVDVTEILMVTAATLREQPTRILTTNHLLQTVLAVAGPDVTTGQLRPVWEAIPKQPDGDEHAEYAARLTLAVQDFVARTTEQ